MTYIKASFCDFEQYRGIAEDWQLDFKLLSKNDFGVFLNMFMSECVQISRTSLSGKIEQYGLTPFGYCSFVVPINDSTPFVWLGNKVDHNNIMIFPKNGSLEAVSYHNFDVYVVSIHETFLYKLLDNLGYTKVKKMVGGNEMVLSMSPNFGVNFSTLVEYFLKLESSNLKLQEKLLNEIVVSLLKYINFQGEKIEKPKLRKRDVALKKAVDYIHGQLLSTPSIPQICAYCNVSERTLEYAFLEKYQVTPSQYIKAVRLNMVKNDLILYKEQPIKISDIAGKFDFWHMGQFAKDFKTYFGKLPSQV